MPSDIKIPALQGSIKPYFIAVKDYLLTEMTARKLYPANWGKRRQHLVDIQTFAENIDPNTITVGVLIAGLYGAGRNNQADTNDYIDKILNGLRVYLTQTEHYSNNNTLMLAALKEPDEVEPILDAMTHLNTDLRNTMLIQVTHTEGFNALMFAARHHPEIVTPILRAMSYNPHLLALAMLKPIGGQNALMLAACYQPDAVVPILEAITRLNPNQQAEMFHYYGDNALMIAARYQPDAVTPILEAVNRLDPNLTVKMLEQVDHTEGDNALMLAVRYQPTALPPILATIKRLNPIQQIAMFKQATRIEHYNALMIAAFYQPEAVTPIIRTMTELNADRQVEVLAQVTMTFGDNALMLALIAKDQPCVDSILSRINTFAPEQKKQILLTPNKAGKTALDLVTGHFNGELHPSRTSILTVVDSIDNPLPLEGDAPLTNSSSGLLPGASSALASSSTASSSGHVHHPDTISIENLLDRLSHGRNINETYIDLYITSIRNGLRSDLLQVDTHGNNILMLAAHKHPNIVAPILTAMAQLNTKLQVEMLSQINKSDSINALMFAAHCQPDAVDPILDAITLLDPDLQVAILRQVTMADGNNALMIAAISHPKAVDPILTAMARLGKDLQAEMLSQVTMSQGNNALMLAVRFQPEAVDSILTAMTCLGKDLQAEMLSQVTTSQGNNALMLAVIAKNQPCVDSILSRVNTLSPEQKTQILLTPNKKGKTALDLVTGHFNGEPHPSRTSILAAVNSIYNPLPLEGSALLISSSISSLPEASSSTASSSSFFHHPDTSRLFAAQLLHSDNPTKTFNKKLLDYAKGRLNGYLYGVSNVLFHQKRNHREDVEQIIYQIEKEEITNVGEVIVKLEHIPAVKPEGSLAKRIIQIRHKCLFESAVRYQPFAIGPLLDTLKCLHIESAKIPYLARSERYHDGFRKYDFYDFTIWRTDEILCREGHIPKVVGQYLKEINNLQDEAIKAAVLSRISKRSWSALIFAARHYPSEAKPLLKALNSLQDEKTVLLKQCYPNNEKIPAEHNALMLAAAYEPKAVESILFAITTLDIEDQIDIFNKTNEQGNNALQLTVNYKHSHSEALIRQAMEKFIPSTITKPAALSSSSPTLQILDREELDPLDAEHDDPVIDGAAGSASCS